MNPTLVYKSKKLKDARLFVTFGIAIGRELPVILRCYNYISNKGIFSDSYFNIEDFDELFIYNIEEYIETHINNFYRTLVNHKAINQEHIEYLVKSLAKNNKNMVAEWYLECATDEDKAKLKYCLRKEIGDIPQSKVCYNLDDYIWAPDMVIAKTAVNALSWMMLNKSKLMGHPCESGMTLSKWKNILCDINFYLAVKATGQFDLLSLDDSVIKLNKRYDNEEEEYLIDRYHTGKKLFGKYFDDLWD